VKSQGKKRHLHALGVNLLLCIVSVSVFLGGTEALARLHYTPQKVREDSLFEYGKDKVFRLKKNFFGSDWGGTYSTNSHGFRSSEITKEKPENTKRILMVGDSVTFGEGVDNNEIFSYYLERQMNEYYSGSGKNVRIEVLNTAAPGNSPFQEYYDVKRGLEFDPDLIVLQITLNDIIDAQGKWIFSVMGTEESKSNGVSSSYITGRKKLPHLDFLLKQRSALYLFLKDMNSRVRFRDAGGELIAEKAAAEENDDAMLLILEPENPAVKEGMEYALSWIQIMVALAEERDIPFVLFVTPFHFQTGYYEQNAYPQHELRRFAEEENIYFADFLAVLWQLLIERKGGKKTINQIIDEWLTSHSTLMEDFREEFFLDFVHFNPEGHKLAADTLMPIVIEALNLQNTSE